MRFGVGDFSGQRPPGSAATHAHLYTELLRQAEAIEAAGLDSMWLSEHHFAEDGYLPSVLPLCAALLAVTRTLVVGSDRLLASLHHPVRLAEDAMALDLLGRGRFVLGLSLCYRDAEFSGFGADPDRDVERLERAAALVRAAGRGELGVRPGPCTPGGPPLMIAADGPGEAGAARAARLADVLMVDPTEPWERAEELVRAYRRLGGGGEVAIFAYGAISEAGAGAAWAEIEAGFRHMRHTYDRWMGRPPASELPPPGYRLLLGTVEEVAARALEYPRRLGDGVHLVLRLNYPGMPHEAVTRQVALWGEVALRVRAAGSDVQTLVSRID